MPVSRFQPRLDINGVIDTDQTVLENMNRIADNSAMFLTYDITQGKWSVILNRRETDIVANAPLFDNDNIVGSINVARSSLSESANSARVSFPNKDLRGDTDQVYIYIPEADFLPNETRKELSLTYDLINNSVQAAIVGRIDLKQGRSDRVVTFKTDYSSLGKLKAGQLFVLTNEVYGYTTKIFRTITIEEVEGDDGELLIEITALEYDDAVYGETGIVREEKNKLTGLKPATINPCVIDKDAEALADDLDNEAVKGKLTNEVFAFITGKITIRTLPWTTSDLVFNSLGSEDIIDSGYSFTVPYTGRYMFEVFINYGVTASLDGSGNFLLPEFTRKRAGTWIEINGTVPTSDMKTTGIFQGEDPFADQNLYCFIDCNEGDELNFKMRIHSDLDKDTAPNTGAICIHDVALTGRLKYYGIETDEGYVWNE